MPLRNWGAIPQNENAKWSDIQRSVHGRVFSYGDGRNPAGGTESALLGVSLGASARENREGGSVVLITAAASIYVPTGGTSDMELRIYTSTDGTNYTIRARARSYNNQTQHQPLGTSHIARWDRASTGLWVSLRVFSASQYWWDSNDFASLAAVIL